MLLYEMNIATVSCKMGREGGKGYLQEDGDEEENI